MSVAANFRLVKRRVDDYLWHDHSPPLQALRHFLDQYILPFDGAAIVGGLVRDLARKGRRGFQSDIDIVINAPSAKISALAGHLGAVQNRFGGYLYKEPRWKIDFWALESTWAVANGHVAISSIEDVVRSTFFDCDAIVYDLKRRAVFSDDDYLSRLRTNMIEINLLPNPSVNGNMLRAIRRILYWDLLPGPKLQEFLLGNLNQDTFDTIAAVERKLYANPVLCRFTSVRSLTTDLFVRYKRHRFDTSFAEQIEFPEI